MVGFVTGAISGIARKRFIPASIRASYAEKLRKAWRFLPAPIIAPVNGVGRMWLEPKDFIDCRLFLFKTWEPEVTKFIEDSVKPGAIVIDIGANIGYYSLIMSRLVGPTGKVYAIEPNDIIRKRLEENIALNGATNISVVPYGISDRSERRGINYVKGNRGATHFGEVSDDGLELKTLADVIDPSDVPLVSFIKIDVEGMEVSVLRSVFPMIPAMSDDLTITAELRSSPEVDDLIRAFKKDGFTMTLIPNDYRIESYVAGVPGTSKPIDELPSGQHDVAFRSRLAALKQETLQPPRV